MLLYQQIAFFNTTVKKWSQCSSFSHTFVSQVSYQGLDTENQRLQKALENSSKKIQQLEAELQEVETENQTLQRNLEELKISSKRLEQLEQEVGRYRYANVLQLASIFTLLHPVSLAEQNSGNGKLPAGER